VAFYHLADNRYKQFRIQMAWGLIGLIAAAIGYGFLIWRSEQQKKQEIAEAALHPYSAPSVEKEKQVIRSAKEVKSLQFEQLHEQLRLEGQNRDWVKMDELARKILAIDPKDGEAWSYLGLMNEKGGDYQKAADAYGNALDAGFVPSFTLLKRGNMNRLLGEYSKAIADLQEAARLDPGSTSVPNLILIVQIQSGEAEKVRKTVANFEEIGLETTANQYLLGKAALALHDGNPGKAAEALAQYRELVPAAVFAELLQDPFFAPYRNEVALLPFYLSQ
jgi:tetratricopeptide (TPR) repeat protein